MMTVLNTPPKISSHRKFLPYLALLAILSFTVFAWYNWTEINREKEQQEFKETVYDIRRALTDQLYSYEIVAKGLAGLFLASDEVTEEEFRTYCRYWGVPDRIHGMHFLAYARIIDPPEISDALHHGRTAGTENGVVHSEESRRVRASLTYSEPSGIFSDRNPGWDIFGDDACHPTAERSRDSGLTIMSDMLRLPAASGVDAAPGVLLLYPTYQNGHDLQSVEERRKSLHGYIVTAILPDDLIQRCIPESKKIKSRLTIYDATDRMELHLLYSDRPPTEQRRPLHFNRETVSLYGRQWMLDFESTPAFEAGMDSYTSLGILIAGIVIGLLAFLFVKAQESTRERALEMAKDMTSALQESERQFRLLAENTLDLIWQMDEELRFTYVNPSSESIFGYKPDELIGTRLSDHCSAEEITRIEEDVADIIARGENWSGLMFETFFRHKDGRDIPVEVHSRALVDNHGRLLGFQGTTRDISDRKRAETEKKRLEAQFRQAQKMESVGRLAGGVAHDFNNMLTIILGYTEMILNETDSGQPIYRKLREIHDAAERSANLTQQLLAFARKQTVAPKVLNLNETVKGTLSMMERLIGENVRLSWIPGPDLWQVHVDPAQIDQALANLCVNARDAISDGGNIFIETKNVLLDETKCTNRSDGCVPGEYVALVVRDDGCGMEKAVLDKLFEPFFTTKVMGKGTGLGLATVYGVVKQSFGFIDVTSSPGKGTTFTILLPRYRGDLEQKRSDSPFPKLTGASEVILLVEDESSILTMVRRVLEKQSYTVLAAQSPGDAIRLAKDFGGPIHLLITDVVMPGMDGHILDRELHSIHPRIRCLFMSGYPSDIIARHGVVEEGMHFIQKPFSIDQINAKVREILDDAETASDQPHPPADNGFPAER